MTTQQYYAQLRRKWRRWVKRLRPEVQDLVVSRYIYEVLGRIVQANKLVQSPNDFHTWVSRNYAFTAAVGVRRLADLTQPRRTISMAILLDDIARHPAAITRTSHVRRYSPDMRDAGEWWFDKFAGKGEKTLSSSIPTEDLRQITSAQQRIRVFVNQRIAHLSKRNTRRLPLKLREVHDTIGLIERTYLRYTILLEASAPPTLLPTWQYDWKSVFYRPWIESPPPGWDRD